MTDLVFDIQSFKDKHGRFLPKEVAVGSVDKPRRRFMWVVAPPYSADVLPLHLQSINNRLTTHHHGIHWDTTGITLAELNDELYNAAEGVGYDSRLYAKGREVVQFLKQVTGRKIINLDSDENCPSVTDAPPRNKEVCSWHDHLQIECRGCYCALRNVMKLQCYLNRYNFLDLLVNP